MHKKILTVFCGRQKFLEILFVYLDILLDLNIIDEVHLWDYTQNPNNGKIDLKNKEYIKNTCLKNKHYHLKIPEKYFFKNNDGKTIRKKWSSYYNYYRDNSSDCDKIIKCDDDIVYIDIDSFEKYIESICDDYFLYPNIVNNDVCAYWQQKYGVHDLFDYKVDYQSTSDKHTSTPLSNWAQDKNKAFLIHDLFLKDPKSFIISSKNLKFYGSRLSINMFGITGAGWRKYLHNDLILSDESFVSCRSGAGNFIKLDSLVSHFSFGPQSNFSEEERILSMYKELSLSEKIRLKNES